MKTPLALVLLFGCSPKYSAPVWVDGIRSGQERLKVTNGQDVLYRRIASTCSQAIRQVEADIRKEHNEVPVLEVQYLDQNYGDCAVTMSITKATAKTKKPDTRSHLIAKHAVNYTTKWDFEKKTKEHVYIRYDYRHYCYTNYYKSGYSAQADWIICWKGLQITGIYQAP